MNETNRIEYAVVHNDYSHETAPKFEFFDDRFEITTYGGLPEGLTVDEFFTGRSMPRNKEIMRIFKDLEMVEQLGTGIPRILQFYGKECFSFSDNFVVMTFPAGKVINKVTDRVTNKVTNRVTDKVADKTSDKAVDEISNKVTDRVTNKVINRVTDRVINKVTDKVTDNQQLIIDNLLKNNRLSATELSVIVGISKRKILTNISKLKELGLLVREGNNRGGCWKVIEMPSKK